MEDTNTNLFIKIYRSFLASGGTLEIEQIESPYIQMNPFLHQKAGSEEIDSGAFIYSFLRLPHQIHKVKKIVLAQSFDVLKTQGYDIQEYEELDTPARRRKMYFDGQDKLFVIINSVTDVDDMICLLTAYQIEWNKISNFLQYLDGTDYKEIIENKNFDKTERLSKVDKTLWEKLDQILSGDFEDMVETIKNTHISFKVSQIRGSYINYVNSAQSWFEYIANNTIYPEFKEKPIYFVSSNMHSIVNSISGFVNSVEGELVEFMKQEQLNDLLNYYHSINAGEQPGDKENLLWYVLKKYEQKNPYVKDRRIEHEHRLGIDLIEAKQVLDINVQIIKINQLSKSHLGQKRQQDLNFLNESEAFIVNIDYPLGFGAYMVLNTIMRNIRNVKGVYILGKASFLNGKLGDIALPTKVFDDHTKNTFILNNAFKASDFAEFKAGSILPFQDAVSTKGTLLHPEEEMKQYFIDGYTIIEMENGPYLNALYETINYDRYPEKTLRNMLKSHIDIGIIHYASDTPFTKTVTLGTRSLGYEGVDATYVSSLAILKRIIKKEGER